MSAKLKIIDARTYWQLLPINLLKKRAVDHPCAPCALAFAIIRVSMRKVSLHFKLFLMLTIAFTYFTIRQIQHTTICLFSYRRSIKRLDRYLYRHARLFCNIAELMLGIRYIIPTLDEIKTVTNKPCIVISNHQSLMDIMILIASFPIPIRFVSKKVLGRFIPYISKMIRVYNSALIDRKSGMKTIGTVRDLARRCRRNLTPMIIFPEGTRTKTDNVGKFHNAAVRASLMDGPMNIIVVALDGGLFFPKLLSFPDTTNKRYMYLKVLKVFEDVSRESAKKCLEEAEKLIQNYVTQWRKDHGVTLPLTEHTRRRATTMR